MKLLRSSQMLELDRAAIERHGVPSTLLMSNAARHVAEAALELCGGRGRAAVFCGPGNNGGDGVAAAAHLLKHGLNVRAFLVGERSRMTRDSLEMERRLGELGGVLEDFAESEASRYAACCDVIVDAVFGVGLGRPLDGDALKAVRVMNSSPAFVVSADIPTGVRADTGEILGDAVDADVTVTFTFLKPGHVVEPGCTRCGEVRVVDIGIPGELADAAETDTFTVASGEIALPRRRRDAHKGDFGRDLIIAGSVGYSGAPALSAKAASMAGAGLVFLGVPEAIYPIVASKCDEEIVFPLPCAPDGRLSEQAVEPVLERLKGADACLVGPGLGRSAAVERVVAEVLRNSSAPVVLDADGINAISGNIDILDEARCPVILTPHAGEFKRLGGDLSAGRLDAARRFAESHRCVLVLKGHRTITALPDGTAYVNTTGGPAMAKGGTGDVLAGMVTALAGQKFPLKDAVLASVHIHGLAGDMCAKEYGEYSVSAGHIIKMLPRAMKSVTA